MTNLNNTKETFAKKNLVVIPVYNVETDYIKDAISSILNGVGTQVRDFIYIEDIADICVKTLKFDIKNEVINFLTNKGGLLNELIEEMSKIYRYGLNVTYIIEGLIDMGEIKRAQRIIDLISLH